MSLKFWRRIRIAPGLRVNLSKSGASVSIGHRGAWYTIGPRGQRMTVGARDIRRIFFPRLSSGARARRTKVGGTLTVHVNVGTEQKTQLHTESTQLRSIGGGTREAQKPP